MSELCFMVTEVSGGRRTKRAELPASLVAIKYPKVAPLLPTGEAQPDHWHMMLVENADVLEILCIGRVATLAEIEAENELATIGKAEISNALPRRLSDAMRRRVVRQTRGIISLPTTEVQTNDGVTLRVIANNDGSPLRVRNQFTALAAAKEYSANGVWCVAVRFGRDPDFYLKVNTSEPPLTF